MEKKSKGRSRPMPDASELKNIAFKLEEALANEEQFICDSERKPWEVTMSARDGAVHVLRFLKVWFDVPQSVFFSAVSYLDQFLAKMKVQGKYLSCLSVSCFNVAAQIHGFKINASQLVMLSQSKCSVKDMERMSTIIKQKLNPGINEPSNALDLLKVYMDIFKCIAVQFNTEVLFKRILQWDRLSTRLEVLISNSSCAFFKPSALVLTFLHYELDRFLSKEVPKNTTCYSMEMFYILAVMIELQYLCKIKSSDYSLCYESVVNTLKEYDDKCKAKHCQRLSWRFSTSTHAISKLCHHYSLSLNTVKEE